MMDQIKSTKTYRNSQRATGVQEIVIGILQSVSLETMLPIKVAQTVTNLFVAVGHKAKRHERAVAATESLLALTSATLATILIFQQEPCRCLETTDNKLCIAIGVLELIFQGVLLITWVPGELFKEDCPQANRPRSDSQEPLRASV